MKKLWSLLLGLLLLSGCVQTPRVTPQQENYIGTRQERQILRQVRTIRSGKLYQAVVRVGKRLAYASGRRDFRWNYHLIDNPKVANAFVLPGGKVFVYSGLFRYVANDNELAVVLGHEIAHALRSHGIQRMQRQQEAGLVGAVLQVGMHVAGVDHQTAREVNQIYNQTATLGYLRPYSRKNESEADALGLFLMAKAGYDPRAALSFWKKFGASGPRIPEFLSTHPSTYNRIAHLKRLMPKALEIYRQSIARRHRSRR